MSRAQHRVVKRDSDVLGGTPGFAGTRVPMQALVDYLEAGEPLSEDRCSRRVLQALLSHSIPLNGILQS